MLKDNIRTKNIIENLRKEIKEKNKIIEDYKNNNIYYFKNNIDEQIIREHNENKLIIENLKKEIYSKSKIIEDNKIKAQNNTDKYLIEKLKQEICSKNYTIMDYKKQLDKLIIEDNNNKKIINDLNNEIYNKDQIINDYNSNLMNGNDNVFVFYDVQNNNNNQDKKVLNRNIETIKETYIKEINKYKEIIKQKETEIIRIKQSGNNVNELQKIIEKLKKENSQLFLKAQDYDNLQAEIEFLYKRGGNYSFKEINRTTLKLAYDSLIEENKKLKEQIMQLQNIHY